MVLGVVVVVLLVCVVPAGRIACRGLCSTIARTRMVLMVMVVVMVVGSKGRGWVTVVMVMVVKCRWRGRVPATVALAMVQCRCRWRGSCCRLRPSSRDRNMDRSRELHMNRMGEQR